MKKLNHDVKVGIWGGIGAIGIFLFAIGLAAIGPYIEKKSKEFDGKEESSMSMSIEESALDDIRDSLTELSVEFNGKQYVLVDTAMDVLQDYLDTEED